MEMQRSCENSTAALHFQETEMLIPINRFFQMRILKIE